jgi:hypothetical protein
MWFVVFILVYLLNISQIFAGSFAITDLPETVDAASVFYLDYTYICSGCEKKPNYFFGALKASDSARFFGLNQVGDQWINYEADKNALLYSFASPSAEGTWSGHLAIKPIDTNNITTLFKGAGNYILKIFRYTPSSSSDTFEIPIILTITPFSTPTPTPAPTATNSPISTPQPTPTPLPTTTPTQIITPKPLSLATPLQTPLITSPSAQIFEESLPAGSVAGSFSIESLPNTNRTAPILITLGAVLVLGGVLPLGFKMMSENETGN